jgi:hypothetical protein
VTTDYEGERTRRIARVAVIAGVVLIVALLCGTCMVNTRLYVTHGFCFERDVTSGEDRWVKCEER